MLSPQFRPPFSTCPPLVLAWGLPHANYCSACASAPAGSPPSPPHLDLPCCRILGCADLRQLQAGEGAASFLCAPVLLEARAPLVPEAGQRPAAAVLLVCYPSTAAAPQE